MDYAIRVEKLGKRYRIGERETYRALRDTLTGAVTAPLRRLRPGRRAATDNTIWFNWIVIGDPQFDLASRPSAPSPPGP